jgi:hypothetical protein
MIWKEEVVAYSKYRGTCLQVIRGIVRNYNESEYQEGTSINAIPT